jgi:hypothetical protein
VKFWERSDAPPAFVIDGLTFIFIRRGGLLLACTSRFASFSLFTIYFFYLFYLLLLTDITFLRQPQLSFLIVWEKYLKIIVVF